MLGSIIGDIVSSVYEFNNYKAKGFEPFFHEHARFTDDTVCTVAIADALTGGIHPAVSLKAWGEKYWENGSWGRSFALWLDAEDSKIYGSYGNGSAMLVFPAGLLATSHEEAIRLAHAVTEVRHSPKPWHLAWPRSICSASGRDHSNGRKAGELLQGSASDEPSDGQMDTDAWIARDIRRQDQGIETERPHLGRGHRRPDVRRSNRSQRDERQIHGQAREPGPTSTRLVRMN